MKAFAVAVLLAAAGPVPVPAAMGGPGPVSGAAAGSSGAPAVIYAAPVPGRLMVTRGFDPPATAYGPGHRGVDLAAVPGSSVLAAAAGTVSFAGPVAGVLAVTVLHADGVRTTYEPLVVLRVHRGAGVSVGTVLGSLGHGHPGCTAPAGLTCLHWGALRGTTYLDPLLLLDPGPIALLTPVPTSPRTGSVSASAPEWPAR